MATKMIQCLALRHMRAIVCSIWCTARTEMLLHKPEDRQVMANSTVFP